MKTLNALTIAVLLPVLPALAQTTSAMAAPPPLAPLPTPAQLRHQRYETIMFIHFGPNTFTDRQWGTGKESPDDFNPTDLDCEQWVRVAKEGGFNLIIPTIKHHEGFCLWPSKYTEHSVKNSKWRGGKGDLARDFVNACKKHKIDWGWYLSPWDMHDKRFVTAEYNDYFCDQIKELSTEYGPVVEYWFDGAFGTKNICPFDWKRIFDTIYRYQADTLVSMMGPDIGWAKNERATGPATNWNLEETPYKVPSGARPGDFPIAYMGHEVKEEIKPGVPNYKAVPTWRYMHKECNTSIMPSWFWTPAQSPKSLDWIIDTYFNSVGRGGVFLLSLSPDRTGQIPENQVQRLMEFRRAKDAIFATDLAGTAKTAASTTWSGSERFHPQTTLDGDLSTYWAAERFATSGTITFDLGAPQTFNVIRMQEPVQMGQRVAKYVVEMLDSETGKWVVLSRGTTIGHKKLDRVPTVTAQQVRLVIEDARSCPLIAEFGLHLNPMEERRADGPGTQAASVKGRVGKARRFAGDALTVAHDPEIDPQALTLITWVNMDSFPPAGPDQRRWIANKNGNEYDDSYFGLIVDHRGAGAYLNIGGGKANSNFASSDDNVLQSGQWHQIAMTYDGADLRLYVDGQQAADKAVGKPRNPGRGAFVIGQRADKLRRDFNGRIDEVRFYDRALKSEEIKALFLAPDSDEAHEGIRRFWQFDD